ncbi:SigE family RNA polymerase sigma factor [Fodinicola acaciae]|uniref:SigE family RNA polymerase sigma factor n=1 Tax=Fodinicola acaciae TaxID=2681555 RepID=UPI0013D5BA75|nr:SigE family RNA polymerase sigma factor [Fodinicola acaciae]
MRADRERRYVEYATARMPALRRTAYMLTGDPHRSDDLVQHAMTKLYQHWRRVEDYPRLDAYVRRILVNAFLEERRHAWTRVALVDRPPDVAVSDPDRSGDREILHAALLRVPPRQRAMLVLRFLNDMSISAVAELFRVSEGTVKSQTARGLEAMRRALEAEAPDAYGRKVQS